MDLFLHYLSLPYLLEGIAVTLQVTGLGLIGGLMMGIILAAMQLSRFGVLAAFARGYSVIFRGTPLILQMVFVYDALPHIGIKLPAILAAGTALAANEAPFISEILRAGVLGVDRGQILAGQALGMTPGVLMNRIIAPQAIRAMIPAFGAEAVSALKNSSLASVIAVQELTLRSTQLASSTFDFFSIFFASGLVYLCLTGAIKARSGRPCQARPNPSPQQRGGRARRLAQALRQAGRARRRRSDGAHRRGGRAARSLRFRQKHVAALYQPSGGLGRRHDQGRRPASRFRRQRKAVVAARTRQRARRGRRRHGVPAVQSIRPFVGER